MGEKESSITVITGVKVYVEVTVHCLVNTRIHWMFAHGQMKWGGKEWLKNKVVRSMHGDTD